MRALALTDHGSMYGTLEFYQAARAAGVKPIIGCLLAGQEIITADGVKNVEDVQVATSSSRTGGAFAKLRRPCAVNIAGAATRSPLEADMAAHSPSPRNTPSSSARVEAQWIGAGPVRFWQGAPRPGAGEPTSGSRGRACRSWRQSMSTSRCWRSCQMTSP